jgi:regulator of protease activity HflC (stomatin/prohibitin superfamily)
MFFIIIAIVFGLIALFTIGGAVFSQERAVFVAGFLAVALVFGVITLVMSITTVDARSVAIQQSFGRYQDTLGPGLQLIAPWSSTEEFTTRLQDVDLNSKDGGKDSVYVSFSAPKQVDENGKVIAGQTDVAGGGNGYINAVVRWSINPDQSSNGAKALWEKYKTFDDVKSRLVTSESQQAVTDVANDYTAGVASVNQTDIGDAVKVNLTKRLSGYGILVDSVAIKGVDLDSATKASLQRIVDNINKTQAAKEEAKRAEIDNQIAEQRAKTGTLSASNMQRYCLDVVNNWDVAKNGPLPATFDCSLGSSGKNVLVNAGK